MDGGSVARFSIEDSLFEKSNFKAFQRKLGNALALGVWTECGRLAQAYWKRGKKIPKEEFKFVEYGAELVEFGFVTEHNDGFLFGGSEKYFKWLVDAIEGASKGGQESAKRPRDEKGHFLPKEAPTPAQPPADPSPAHSSALTLTLPLTSSLPLKILRTLPSEEGESVDPAQKREVSNPVGYFIGCYRKAFQERYGAGTNPDVRGKVQGQIKALLKDYPIERAIRLIQVFLQLDGDNRWFLKKRHDFGTFMENLNVVSVALDTGESSVAPQMFSIERELALKEGTNVATRV